MKVIIAGSREVTSYAAVRAAVTLSGFAVSEVVSGTARGVDKLGEQWAVDHAVPVHPMPADWPRHGSAAGRLRNNDMAEYADALVAVWDGRSPGTKHMIEAMQKRGKPTFVYRVAL